MASEVAAAAGQASSTDTTGPLPSGKPPTSRSALPLGTVLSSQGQIDAFLSHLHRCMQTPGGVDTVLQIVWASSRLASIVLSRHAPQRSARDLLSLLLPFATPTKDVVLPLAQRLKALASLVAEARAMLRLWGLLGMYLSARRLVGSLRSRLASPTSPGSVKGNVSTAASVVTSGDEKPLILSVTQLLASTLFQATDNGNLLSRHGVVGWTPAQQGRMAQLGARAWFVVLGTELGRLAFEIWKRQGGGGSGDVQTAEERATVVKLQKSWIRNAAWAPIILSGAVGGGLVSEMTGALLAMVPSVIMMKDLWRDTEVKA